MADLATLDRRRLEAGLAEFVAAHRFLIAVVFPAVGGLTLVASAEGLLPSPLAFNPYLILFGTVVMRLPLVAALAPLTDRRAALGLLALAAYAYGVELVGVETGLPYGEFAYGVELGPMLFGLVPVGLPVFFFPIVLNSYLLCLLLLGPRARQMVVRVPVVAACVVALDVVLDPAAVSLGFWSYAGGGPFYGVPLSNFAGWVLSATVSVALVDLSYRWSGLVRRVRDCAFALDDLVSFVVLWGLVNAYYGNWVPVAVALALGAGLLRADRFDFAVESPLGRLRGG